MKPLPKNYSACWKSPKDAKRILLYAKDVKYMILIKNVPYRIRRASLLWPDLRNDIHLVHLNTEMLPFEHNFYGLETSEKKSNIKLCLLLNSTFSAFIFEILSRTGLGGGAARLVKLDIKRFYVLHINYFELDNFSRFRNFLAREVKSIFEELGFDKTKPSRLQEPNPLPDRKALDDIVFDALGLTEAERKEVYWSVAELVKNRLDKAKSV